MSLFVRSDSTLVDETIPSPRIELPEPTAPFNSYDREDYNSDDSENGLDDVQEMIMGAIEELLEKLPCKVKGYLHIKGKNHQSDAVVDEIRNDSRGIDFDGDKLKNERFKVRIVDIGGSSTVPVKQVQDNTNGKK